MPVFKSNLFTQDDVNNAVNSALAANKPAEEFVQVGGLITLSSNITPVNNVPPQNTQGTQFLFDSITVQGPISKVLIMISFNGSVAVPNNVLTWALFRDNIVDAIHSRNSRAAIDFKAYSSFYIDSPGALGKIDYFVRGGANASNFYVNGDSSGNQVLGGSCQASLYLKEILP
jgi:hypothetical protein